MELREKMEEERSRLRKFCIDTRENRQYILEHIDDAPMNGIPIIKYLLEEISILKARLTQLELKEVTK